jgi:hypothetical protein
MIPKTSFPDDYSVEYDDDVAARPDKPQEVAAFMAFMHQVKLSPS